MEALWNVVRVVIVAFIVVAVAEVSKRSPRLGAVLLSLPLMSILAFLFSWFQHHDQKAVGSMARDTLVLVPLGLPFFVPFAVAERFSWSFWACMGIGLVLASAAIVAWLAFSPGR